LGEKVDDPLKMYLADIFTVAANLAGIPGLSIPAGFTGSGLPVGLQLLGNHFSESTLFEIGKLYQQHTSWHKKQPELK
jgi:aspartyl-tRNA(Asn)/glutamyl-tRNA(Gln) amidotransferase subunit A